MAIACKHYIAFTIVGLFVLLLWCEFIVYYVHLALFCSWPESEPNSTTTIMALSDTHLLGTIKGHWFDKLRREWQMYRSFQTAITLFSPQNVFILGDIFDEGQWASPSDFKTYVARFHSLFYLPKDTKLYSVIGNHDIGFHYWTNEYLVDRFEQAMNVTTVDSFYLSEAILLIRINSIALENDGCSLCAEAIRRIERQSTYLRRMEDRNLTLNPIVITHFPLYRPNEMECQDEDSAPDSHKPNREKFDCLSREISQYLLGKLKPRLVLNGHVHHSCHRTHSIKENLKAEEYTVASFNWRNKVNPSFLLIRLTGQTHSVFKCFLPDEATIISTYVVCLCFLLITLIIAIICEIKHKID